MDRTSQVPDPERLLAYLKAEPSTITNVYELNPHLRQIATHAGALRLRMQHTYGENVSDQILDEVASEAFTATMLLTILYDNRERVLLVKAMGDVLLSEASTSFVPVARSLPGRVVNQNLAALVRARMDTHLLCYYANQMREPREYVHELASELIREKQYIDTAVKSVMQHHRYVGQTFH